MLDSCDYSVNTEDHTKMFKSSSEVSSTLLFISGKSLDIIRMPVHIKIQSDDTSSTHFINMGIRTEHIVCKHYKV
jgi:hypothetical protein